MAEEIRTVRTKHAELSLEQLADALPSTGEVMANVAVAWWRCAHAARGGNWPLAAYYARRVRGLQRGLAITRPKHRERVERYERDALNPLLRSIESNDAVGFARIFDEATELANDMHVETGHGYIKWVLPDEAPLDVHQGPVRIEGGKQIT